jgi:hypothetical protein
MLGTQLFLGISEQQTADENIIRSLQNHFRDIAGDPQGLNALVVCEDGESLPSFSLPRIS